MSRCSVYDVGSDQESSNRSVSGHDGGTNANADETRPVCWFLEAFLVSCCAARHKSMLGFCLLR